MSAVPTQLPDIGWQARLELQFERREHRTVLAHRAHSGPLLIQRPFYPEGGPGEPCHVYLIHPPGGVVGGDELSLEVGVHSQAHALLTTPAAGKFYRRHGARVARLTSTFDVDDGVLEWMPQENIYYPDAAVELRSIVRLRRDARFIGWEIGCLGLPASQRTIDSGSVRLAFELWRDERPLLLERLHIDQRCLNTRWGMAGYSSFGTWIGFAADAAHLEQARNVVQLLQANCNDVTLACTLMDGVLCCRGYAARCDLLKQAFIKLWCALRVELLGREAKPPRIWMT